jgi:hypothetical protein
LQIEGKRGELMAILEELPTVELLDTLDLEPAPDIFLETLILCVNKLCTFGAKEMHQTKKPQKIHFDF